MSESRAIIRLDENGRTYFPGDTLSGSYHLDGISSADVKAIEVSILWHTEGKGDEDLAVHHFQRREAGNRIRLELPPQGRFRTVLPNSPLSYDGAIVKVGWCVRVRVFQSGGKELLSQRSFRLGKVRPGRLATS
ncbi:MAG: hypothetical protein HQ581_06835 [Planctomycetes bacterium]|nr:hypothetical protein [Planctomycetota bacterium]